ncbi:MAG TPA: FliM/FliN family flagellar motor C-terminal domain-containing protein [Tepidisphaeraceae bacterium]
MTRVEIGGVSLTLAQLAHIEEGHVIPLDQPVDAPVEVFVGDKLIARGQLIAMDERYAVQLTEVVA